MASQDLEMSFTSVNEEEKTQNLLQKSEEEKQNKKKQQNEKKEKDDKSNKNQKNNTVPNHENLSVEQIAIRDYDPVKFPADIVLTELHQRANRIGKPAEGKPQLVCPCCQNNAQKEEIGICADIEDLGFLGCGIPLFYSFVKYGIYFLGIIFILTGIYGLIKNNKGDGCVYSNLSYFLSLTIQEQADYIPRCLDIYQNFLSTSNTRNKENELDKTYSILHMVCSIFLILSSLKFRNICSKIVSDIDSNNITASDFSVIFTELPLNLKENELQTYFKTTLDQTISKNIKQIVFAYDIHEFVEAQQQSIEQKTQLQDLENLNEKENDPEKKKNNQVKIQQFNETIKKLQQTISKYTDKKLEDFNTCGAAIVTFDKEENKQYVVDKWNHSYLKKLTRIICCQKNDLIIQKKFPLAREAPEPEDIIWENLSYPSREKFWRRIGTYLISFLVMCLCFGLLFGLSLAQIKVRKDNKGKSNIGTQLLSAFMAILIIIINFVLEKIIRKFTSWEKQTSYTKEISSVTTKLAIAQFINTALIQLIASLINNGQDFMIQGGLNQNVIWIVGLNQGVTVFLILFNPFHFLKLYQISKFKKDLGKPNNINQIESHQLFQGFEFDIAKNYSATIKSLLICTFYAYQLPIIPVIGIIGLFLYYWSIKYAFLKRNILKYKISDKIQEDITDSFIEIMLVSHSLGCFLFEYWNYNKNYSVFSIIQLIITSAVWIFPVDKCFESTYKVDKTTTSNTYTQSRFNLSSDYGRSNPLTKKKAFEEWFLEQQKKYNYSEDQVKQILEQNRNQTLGDYAQQQANKNPGQLTLFLPNNQYNPLNQFQFLMPQNNNLFNQQPIQNQSFQMQQMSLPIVNQSFNIPQMNNSSQIYNPMNLNNNLINTQNINSNFVNYQHPNQSINQQQGVMNSYINNLNNGIQPIVQQQFIGYNQNQQNFLQ